MLYGIKCWAIIYIYVCVCSLNGFNWNENVKIDKWKYKEWKKFEMEEVT